MPRAFYVWELTVREGMEDAFLEKYGPAGAWAKLFSRAEGYLGTLLLRDSSSPRRFLTIDRWESAEAHQAFLQLHGADYAALDRECEALTVEERNLGELTESLGERGQGNAAKAWSPLVDERIRSLADWRGEVLAEVRRLIHEAEPEIEEDCKWGKPSNPLGVPVWSHAGIVCTGETYKTAVKLTFARGASLADPHGLFNASLEGRARRAIDIREGERLDAEAFKALIQAAVAENLRASGSRSRG